MTTREKLLGVGIALAAIAALIAGRAWLTEHDARVHADAAVAAQQTVIAAAQKQFDAAQASSAQVAGQLTEKLAQLQAEKQQPATAADLAAMINALLPKGAPPVTVQQASPATGASQAGEANQSLPAAPGVSIPQADVTALRDYGVTCQENAAKSQACVLELASTQQEVTATQTQLTATAKERDAYKTELKGGTLMSRLAHGAKCFAMEGGLTAIGAAVDKQQPARGAVIGLAVGGLGCRL